MKTKFLALKERYKFLKTIHHHYQKASKKKKGEILNLCYQTTGLGRKHLITLFKQEKNYSSNKKKKKTSNFLKISI